MQLPINNLTDRPLSAEVLMGCLWINSAFIQLHYHIKLVTKNTRRGTKCKWTIWILNAYELFVFWENVCVHLFHARKTFAPILHFLICCAFSFWEITSNGTWMKQFHSGRYCEAYRNEAGFVYSLLESIQQTNTGRRTRKNIRKHWKLCSSIFQVKENSSKRNFFGFRQSVILKQLHRISTIIRMIYFIFYSFSINMQITYTKHSTEVVCLLLLILMSFSIINCNCCESNYVYILVYYRVIVNLSYRN